MGLKKYCENLIRGIQNEASLKFLYKSQQQLVVNQQTYKSLQNELESQIIRGVLNNMISKIETSFKQNECQKMRTLINTNKIDRSKLSLNQENLRNLLILKDKEMQNLKQNIRKIESQIELLKKPYYFPDSSIFSTKI